MSILFRGKTGSRALRSHEACDEPSAVAADRHPPATTPLGAQPGELRLPSEPHSNAVELSTKVQPTAASVEDNQGQWVTISDSNDSARGSEGGAIPRSPCKAALNLL